MKAAVFAFLLGLLLLTQTGCSRDAQKTPAEAPAPKAPSGPAPPLEGLVADRVAGIFAETGAPNMVVAVVQGDQVFVRGYGETQPESGLTPDGRSLVPIASLSKVMAGEVLAGLTQDGVLQLTDALQAHAIPGGRVPVGPGGGPITLLDLATHTSGLPRSAPDPEKARWAWLAGQVLLTNPGRDALYSNAAFDLAGDAMAQAARKPYVRLLAERVTGPRGMVDTTATPSEDQCARVLAGAYGVRCKPMPDTAASGGLYSTADDMAAWLRHEVNSRDPVTVASQRIYVQRGSLDSVKGMDHAGEASGLGLGWVRLEANGDHPALIEKTGGLGGFFSYVAVAPGGGAGVYVSVPTQSTPVLKQLMRQVNALTGDLAKVN